MRPWVKLLGSMQLEGVSLRNLELIKYMLSELVEIGRALHDLLTSLLACYIYYVSSTYIEHVLLL